MDRISRGENYIGNLSVSLIGGIQPARLRELRGLTSDGLLQRFVPMMVGAATFACDCASDDEKYGRLVRQLIFAAPQRLIFTDDALAEMEALRKRLHELEQARATARLGADGVERRLPALSSLRGTKPA